MEIEISEEMKKKLERIDKLSEMTLVYGIVDEDRTVDDVLVWKYAIYMEYGTTDKDDKTIIPARPFFRSFQWNKRNILKSMCKRMYNSCIEGNIEPIDAYKRIGRYCRTAIFDSLMNGEWAPNTEKTIKEKGSSQPLVDTGTMSKCIGFVIYHLNDEIYREVIGSARKL